MHSLSRRRNVLQRLRRRLAVAVISGTDTDALMERAGRSMLSALKYKLGAQFVIDRDFPLHIFLELSRACNYRCPMCLRTEAPSEGHFPEDLARKIILEAAAKGPTSYSLHLFGEPLINPRWDRIVEMIRTADPRNGLLLTTNGFFMNEACCKRLLELRVNRVFVTIHSLDPETYTRNTGGGDLSVILENIRTFAGMAGPKCRTKLFVRLYEAPGEDAEQQALLDELRSLGVFFEIRGYHNFTGDKKEWTSYPSATKRWPCYHPWFVVGVTVEGNVTVCCADARSGLCVGSAFLQTIEELWQSGDVKSMRREHMNARFRRWKTCGPCDAWQIHPDVFFGWQKTPARAFGRGVRTWWNSLWRAQRPRSRCGRVRENTEVIE